MAAIYATPDELRTELRVDEAALSDADAERLIETAEDLIDAELSRAIVTTTGRRVAEADVAEWQWAKLSRATVLVAARLYSDPDLAQGRQWQAERGPTFAVSGPIGDELGRQVLALLAATGWKRTSANVTLPSVLEPTPPA